MGGGALGQASAIPAPVAPPSVRTVQVALIVLVIAFLVSTIPGVRGISGFGGLLDGWLRGSIVVLAALLAILRPVTSAVDRTLWTLVAAALAVRALAIVTLVGYERNLDPVPSPSISEFGLLAMSVLLLIALLRLVGGNLWRAPTRLVLDGVVGALAVSCLAVTFLYSALDELTVLGRTGVLVTNLVFAILDVGLVVVVIGVVVAFNWRPTRPTAMLAAGVVGFGVVDSLLLYQVSSGTYRPGTWVDGLAVAATTAIAFSAWVSSGPTRRLRLGEALGLVVPSAFALVCLGLLVYSGFRHVPLAGVLLAAAGLVVAIARAAITVRQDTASSVADLSHSEEDLLRFKSLVEASSDFVAIARMDGLLTYLNPAGRELVGLGQGTDVSALTIADFLTPEELVVSDRAEHAAVLARGHWEGESALRPQGGGAAIRVAVASFLIRDAETGEPFAWATVRRSIEARLTAEGSYRDLDAVRRELVTRLVSAEETERARIADDVHDDSVQALAAVDLRLGLLVGQLGKRAPDLAESMEPVQASVSAATDRLRALLFELEPPDLAEGLAGALSRAAGEIFDETRTRWSVRGDQARGVGDACLVLAYRIAKEAMRNAHRHAGAGIVTVDVRETEGGVAVTVADDGVGLGPGPATASPGHRGLDSMRDRASGAGGRWAIHGGHPAGTVVRFWIPGVGTL